MKMSANPRLFSLGSAAIHIRSSPPTCCENAFGGPNDSPPSSDFPVVILASDRLEYARSLSVGFGVMVAEVSCGPTAQSQSPPPAVWSGRPMNFELDPSWVTRNATQPPASPVGPMTKDRPSRSVRILGSAAESLPTSNRFGLNVATGGAPARAGDTGEGSTASKARAATRALERRIGMLMTSFSLMQHDRSVQQVAAVRIAVAEGEGHRVECGRPVIHCRRRERHRVAVIGASASND